jgi:hypothetical protein
MCKLVAVILCIMVACTISLLAAPLNTSKENFRSYIIQEAKTVPSYFQNSQ